jgi:SH3-like domain-containing protein
MFAWGHAGLTMIFINFARRGVLRPAVVAVALALAALPALAAEKNEDGLPLPRFASTRSAPINVRVGPGQKYDVAWIFTKPNTPIEIVAEFDIWREVRDFDGSEGWIQQNLLSGNRAGLVAPWKKGADIPLLAGASDDAGVRAYLGSGFRIDIRKCDGSWCQVDATSQDASGRGATYSGYLKQSDIWGVYEGETF